MNCYITRMLQRLKKSLMHSKTGSILYQCPSPGLGPLCVSLEWTILNAWPLPPSLGPLFLIPSMFISSENIVPILLFIEPCDSTTPRGRASEMIKSREHTKRGPTKKIEDVESLAIIGRCRQDNSYC